MNSRLLQFLNAENITQAQFADSIGVARASISHIISGRNKPSYEFISAMMRRYPQLNPEWLILGKGRMYNDVAARTQNREQTQTQSPSRTQNQNQNQTRTPAQVDELQLFTIDPESSVQLIQEPQDMLQEATVQEPARQIPGQNASEHPQPMSPPAQSSARQRGVSKVIVFFDDGTFQEMRG